MKNYDDSVSIVGCWVCWEENSVVSYGSLSECREEEECCSLQRPGNHTSDNNYHVEQSEILCMMNCEKCGALLDEEWILCQSRCQVGTIRKAGEESAVHSNQRSTRSLAFEQRNRWMNIERELSLHSWDRAFWACFRSREVGHVLLSWCMAGFVLFQISAVAYLVLTVLLPDVLLMLLLYYDGNDGSTRCASSEDTRVWWSCINANDGAMRLLSAFVFAGLFLYSFVVYNYALVLWRSSGKVEGSDAKWFTDLQARVRDFRENRAEKNNLGVLPFLGYSWCHVCQCIKPPRAHHCRRCGVCVYKLDHHCVYAGNKCIGEGNVAPFIRFLVTLIIGSTVCVVISLLYAWLHRTRLFRLSMKSWNFPIDMTWSKSMVRPLLFLYKWFTQAVFAERVWAVVFLTSMAASIGVSLLLHRQLVLTRRSTTWLEELMHNKKLQ